jgi:hypothetical protein
MNTQPFGPELAGLPAELAAELEDHLMESMEAKIRSGMSFEDAREASLRSLGSPVEIAKRCLRESDPREPHRVPMPLQQRVAVVGWLLLAMGFASRVCVANDPSHASIAACLGLSAGSLAMALLIRRARIARHVAIGLSISLTAAAIAGLVQAEWHPWIQAGFALTPASLGFLAAFGALSGGALSTSPRRTA